MKILFLNIYQNKVNRGAETFVSELATRLGRSNEVDIISGDKGPLARWPILWRLYLDPAGLNIFWFSFKKLGAIWKKKYDIVIPLNGGWQPALVRLVTWFYGGKMIISGQSGKGWDDRNNLWCFPNAFVALSTRLTKWAKNVNPFIKVEYIPNGVDLSLFKPGGVTKKYKLEKPIILCVGALTEEKKIELVVRAVAKLKKASLLIVGDGPLLRNITQLCKRLLDDRFVIDKCSHKDMPEVYRAADVFTLPSPWYRSFEIVLLEAMATNLPVVANDDPIRKEIVGEAGILVDPTDAQKYSSALKKALSLKLGEKPRSQAAKFDWNKIAEKYEHLFKSL